MKIAAPPPTGAGPEISILIVAYNSADVISSCITSIAPACTGTRFEVLLIDNGDGSTQALVARRFPFVTLVPSQGNIGFAAANNLLAAQARGRYLLLLNPDVELFPHALDALLAGASRHAVAAAWGGVTLDRAGAPDYGNCVHVPSLREMASRVLGRSRVRLGVADDCGKDVPVEALSGAFAMVDRGTWDQVGGLDARYFLYCEEVDLFYRLAQRGYRFWRIADARCFHDIGHGKVISARRLLYRAKGTMQFVRTHWSRPRQVLAFLLLWLGALERFFVGRTIARPGSRLHAVGEGHRDMALRPGDWRFGYGPGPDRKIGRTNGA